MQTLSVHNIEALELTPKPGADVGCNICNTELVYLDVAALACAMPRVQARYVACPKCRTVAWKFEKEESE